MTCDVNKSGTGVGSYGAAGGADTRATGTTADNVSNMYIDGAGRGVKKGLDIGGVIYDLTI